MKHFWYKISGRGITAEDRDWNQKLRIGKGKGGKRPGYNTPCWEAIHMGCFKKCIGGVGEMEGCTVSVTSGEEKKLEGTRIIIKGDKEKVIVRDKGPWLQGLEEGGRGWRLTNFRNIAQKGVHSKRHSPQGGNGGKRTQRYMKSKNGSKGPFLGKEKREDIRIKRCNADGHPKKEKDRTSRQTGS